jgi:hypothetical protein
MVGTAQEIASPPPDDAEVVDPEHRTYQAVSTRGPALIVLGIAVFIVVIGTVGSILDSGSKPTSAVRSISIADGTVVHLTPATTAMKSIVSAGQPPADILGNLAVPSGSPVVRTVDTDQNETQFDRTVYFTTGLSTDQVADVYKRLLPRLGWSVIYDGDGAQRESQATEVLAKRGSGDGFYWEVGAVVSPTTSAGITPFSLEVFEIPDDN